MPLTPASVRLTCGLLPVVSGQARLRRNGLVHLPGMNEQRAAEPVFLTSRQVADLLRVPLRTVEDWRLTRSGPPWLKLGRHVRYEQAALLAWVREHQHG
ncbi:helix-turn-helix domain-containing protein [Rathayibacter sp. CAU 1779]